MIKVFISPIANDGILRVIEAQQKFLPQFGVEVTTNIQEADVIANHGTDLHERRGVPSVSINHGLYWSRQKWGDDFMEVNRMVVENMRHAVAHTVPSEWVGRAVRRGGFFYPEVVYHGIEADKFQRVESHGGYIAWAKARADFVSDPNDVMRVAPHLPSRDFRSTIGHGSRNLQIVGVMKHAQAKEFIANAGVYLATARETFGIATLEALACGVPVAGFDWGGNSEIILDGVTGYLAPPGDFPALAECIERCLSERERLSKNAMEDVRARWRWEPRIQQYADIFKRVHARYNDKSRPKVSVIVTAYNLDKYLPKCLDSVREQTFEDFECLVVDDANQHSTWEIVRSYAERDKRFSYLHTPENVGLPGARNYGLENSSGHFIRHLDADDYLAPNAVALEVEALERTYPGEKKYLRPDIVYGHLEVVREDGSQFLQSGEPIRGGWPEEEFKWHYQMAHLNQLPSCVMARREVYERSGGFRTRMWRNEDAEFWCRATSLGFRAQKFTQAVTYYHRERHDSKGAQEWNTQGGEPDWTSWFPWRWGGQDWSSGMEVLRRRGDRPRNTYLVPFGAQGNPPLGLRFWYVHDYAYPVVSIIVTCGPGHKKYLLDALDSIQAQTYPDWEVIVVNDTGEEWPADIMGAPWAKVVNMNGNQGVARARNEGYKHTRGQYVIWMDADDYWLPWFLERMVLFAEKNRGVIFSDIFISEKPSEFKLYTYPEFQSETVFQRMRYPGSSILHPRNVVDAMMEKWGGYDPEAPGMEDWIWQVGVHILGFCAYHIPEPLFVYREFTTTKRETDYNKIDAILAYRDAKYPEYAKGDRFIVCGCNSPATPNSDTPASLLTSSGNFERESVVRLHDSNGSEMVMIEYVGPRAEPFSINSRAANNVSYRFRQGEKKPVFLKDAEFLLSLNTAGIRDYELVTNVAAPDSRDPVAFLGQPITA